MKINSWKIKHWLRGKLLGEVPTSASMEKWAEIDERERTMPIRYFLVRALPTWFAVKGMQIRDFKNWFVYRLINEHKYHLVDTGLKPDYYDIDTRMLHANFNMLKHFVEVELAHISRWNEENKKLSDRDAGLKHLEWEICLVHKKEELLPKDHHLIGAPTDQAIAAAKKKMLYLWWVDEWSARIDPWDAVVNQDTDDSTGFYEGIMKRSKRTKKERDASRKLAENAFDIEEKYHKEDTRMLIVLMKVRRSMWT